MAKQQKYYVVWKGHQPGVFDTWPAAQAQIDGYKGALYKSFESRELAEKALKQGVSAYGGGSKGAKRKVAVPQSAIVWKSISVDAACSGNPGLMEYQGVDTRTGERIFHKAFDWGTNNIGEFLAIVHALALLQKQNLPDLPIYTDSATAIAWVRNKKAKTTLERNHRTEGLYELIDRGEAWLKGNTWRNPILKWETEYWGEIPADFGRKK
ncbi:MAG: ribonuclease H family protein [Saprospiraceae bacterium]